MSLFVHEWTPPEIVNGNPVVVLLHGIGLHGEPYESIAAGFTAKGIPLIVPDIRGHGRSEGVAGVLPAAKVLQSDFDAILNRVQEHYAGSPVFLMGESMGGLLAADYARQRQERLAGLILLVPAFRVHLSRLRAPPSFHTFFTAGRILLDTLDNLNASTREPGFITAKLADTFVRHEVDPIYLIRIARMGLAWPRAAAQVKLPLFINVAGEDRIIDSNISEKVYQLAATPSQAKTWRKWEGAFHTVCWDPVAPELMEVVTAWILAQSSFSRDPQGRLQQI